MKLTAVETVLDESGLPDEEEVPEWTESLDPSDDTTSLTVLWKVHVQYFRVAGESMIIAREHSSSYSLKGLALTDSRVQCISPVLATCGALTSLEVVASY